MRAWMALTGIVALAATSCGSDGPDAPAAVEDTAPPPTEAVTTEAVTTTTTPVETIEAVIVDAVRSSATPPFDASDVERAGADGGGVRAVGLVPWQGGFLAHGTVFGPTPLPDELPPEIAEQFPEEITDLFPDGLPDTLEEAMEIIEDADLMDEVSRAVNDIPGAYDAIFAHEPPPQVPVFTWSADGTVWEPAEIVLPDGTGELADIVTAGGHLAIVTYPLPATSPDDTATGDYWSSGPDELIVAETTDLVDWAITRIRPTLPDEVADVATGLAPTNLVAGDSGWVLQFLVTVDPSAIDAPDEPSPELAPYLENNSWFGSEVPHVWSAAWGEEGAMTDPTGEGHPTTEPAMVVATGDGFLHISSTAANHSTDGVSWTTVEGVDPPTMVGSWSGFAQPVPGRVVLSTGLIGPPPIVHLVSDDGRDWQRIDLGGVLADMMPADPRFGNGYLFQEWDETGLVRQRLVATLDGLHFAVDDLGSADLESDDSAPVYTIAAMGDGVLLVGDIDLDAWWRYDLDTTG